MGQLCSIIDETLEQSEMLLKILDAINTDRSGSQTSGESAHFCLFV
jgi:hypothetical protein